jgi:hypothetical protein
MSDTPKAVGDTSKRDRSPQFPYVGLSKAVDRIRVLFAKVKRHEARVADIAKDWGLTPTSSSTDRTVAALIAYGLIDDCGGTKLTRKIKLSESGWRILEDTRPGSREAALAEAALRPRIVRDYAQLWRDGRPDDDHALSQLKFEGNFTEDGAQMFLRVFDDTIRYVSGHPTDTTTDKNDDSIEEESASRFGGARVGDLIQWESGGVLKLERPTRVRVVSADGQYVAVDGSETGIPMSQVIVEQRAPDGQPQPPLFPRGLGELPPIDMRPGESEWMRNRLGSETVVRLLVTGAMGPKEIGKLIRILEAQKSVLADEENGDV